MFKWSVYHMQLILCNMKMQKYGKNLADSFFIN